MANKARYRLRLGEEELDVSGSPTFVRAAAESLRGVVRAAVSTLGRQMSDRDAPSGESAMRARGRAPLVHVCRRSARSVHAVAPTGQLTGPLHGVDIRDVRDLYLDESVLGMALGQHSLGPPLWSFPESSREDRR